jgi:hypothetical protein
MSIFTYEKPSFYTTYNLDGSTTESPSIEGRTRLEHDSENGRYTLITEVHPRSIIDGKLSEWLTYKKVYDNGPTRLVTGEMFEHLPHGSVTSNGVTYNGDIYPVSAYTNNLNIHWEELALEAKDRTIGRFIQKLQQRDPFAGIGHELYIDVFESHELAKLWSELRELLRSFRSNKAFKLMITKAPPTVRASELYLLWTFGISPLIESIKSILSTLNNSFISCEETVSATCKREFASTLDFPGYTVDVVTSVRYRLNAHVRITDLLKVLEGQFGLLTPQSSVYAVIPLSFVLDWFINVGAYFEQLEYLASSNKGYEISDISESYKTISMTRTTGKPEYDWYGVQALADWQAHARLRYYTRNVLYSIPQPSLPKWNVRLNVGKSLSLFALYKTMLHNR